jgi:lipopolysaccharide export system permease protein
MSLAQGWVSLGLVSFSGLLIMLHGGVLAVSLFFLTKRHMNWSLRSLFRRRPLQLSTETEVRA